MTKQNRPPASDSATLKRMRRQKQQRTKPELIVQNLLRVSDRRYWLNNEKLPGSPDISNQLEGWCIFVHGCYWHSHPGCSRATIPKNNRDWWLAKFQKNQERDLAKIESLKQLGLQVLVVWECETLDEADLAAKLASWLPPTVDMEC